MSNASLVQKLDQICTIYQDVRPVISTILRIPFLPRRWKNALSSFQNIMDELCPDPAVLPISLRRN